MIYAQCQREDVHSAHDHTEFGGSIVHCLGVKQHEHTSSCPINCVAVDSSVPIPSTEVQRWADAAMFRAEPMEQTDGRVEPKVYLLSMTADPLGVIAAACKMYKGEVVCNLRDVTHAERREYLEQIQKTHLKAPFEFVDLHFMIEGVTRSFTHQMVRQRTAVYAQESLRFAVKEDAAEAVALPPSIAHTVPSETYGDLHVGGADVMRAEWDQAVASASASYNRLVDLGMPAEDARGLLPHNITTRLHYKTNLRNLMEHAGNRLCTQAQFEWRQVWVKIVEAIQSYDDGDPFLMMDSDRGENLDWQSNRWQYELLASVFRPICYLTGKCEFRANFDRACTIRDRVDANGMHGRPSSEWDTPYGMDGRTQLPIIQAINPAEWLSDPAAARS